MIRAGRTVIDNVNIFMTTFNCQIALYITRLWAVSALPVAPRPVPAPRIAIPTLSAPTLLWRQWAPAGPARPRLRHVSHDPPFSVCLQASTQL